MRALIKSPDLLILDELFLGLDVERKQFCSGVIERSCSRPGRFMLYVTHRREEMSACVEACFELPAAAGENKR